MKRNKGLGFIYQPTYKDRKTGEVRTSPTWWISLSHRGKRVRLSSNSANRADAVRVLKQKLAELGAGRPVGSQIDHTTFEDLARMLTDNYVQKGNKTLGQLRFKLKHLRDFFGRDRAHEITSDRIDAYIAARLGLEHAARGTVNLEVALLRRAFRIARKAGRVAVVPEIELHNPNNTRKGFFEREQFEALMRHLPDDVKPVVHVAMLTGWRMNSEILTRRKQDLDLKNGWLRLESGESKNGEGRQFPLTQELRAVLEAQTARTRELELQTGQIIPWLFHRNGEPIKSIRQCWKTACKAAGVPGRLKHDFRRTACRNFERMGISRSAAMKMVGHKTEAIYRRYAIADEVALKEAAAKIDAALVSTEGTSTLVKAESKQARFGMIREGKGAQL
jgi:integrase